MNRHTLHHPRQEVFRISPRLVNNGTGIQPAKDWFSKLEERVRDPTLPMNQLLLKVE